MALVNFAKNLNKVVRDLRRYGLSKKIMVKWSSCGNDDMHAQDDGEFY